MLSKLYERFLGKSLDPLNPDTRHSIVLIAFLAWIGLGADGLSSACYGPEEAFLALGTHTQLGLYLALATAITVFVIALAYNQVIELFPSGGGGYKVATRLLGPHAGLVSGAALIVDYVLTITISVASGAEALFSLLPLGFHNIKFGSEIILLLLLIALNLRGMMAGCAVLHSVEAGNDPVAEAGCGLTVPPGSAAAVAEGLRALAAMPLPQRQAMGQRGRAFVLAQHAYPVLAQRFIDAVVGAGVGAARSR